jgi:hypothetical protein
MLAAPAAVPSMIEELHVYAVVPHTLVAIVGPEDEPEHDPVPQAVKVEGADPVSTPLRAALARAALARRAPGVHVLHLRGADGRALRPRLAVCKLPGFPTAPPAGGDAACTAAVVASGRVVGIADSPEALEKLLASVDGAPEKSSN